MYNVQKRKHAETDDEDDKEVAMIFSKFNPTVQDCQLKTIESVKHQISTLNLSKEEFTTAYVDCKHLDLDIFDDNEFSK
jgi:hypothetical protein